MKAIALMLLVAAPSFAQVTVDTVDRIPAAERAAIAAADDAKSKKEDNDNRALRIQISATVDGLKTNVNHRVFTAEQRDEFKKLTDYTLELAKEVQRLRGLENKKE